MFDINPETAKVAVDEASKTLVPAIQAALNDAVQKLGPVLAETLKNALVGRTITITIK